MVTVTGDTVVTVATYNELDAYIRLYRDGTLPLMILSGAPGVGKSEQVKAALKGHKHHYIEGYLTKTELIRALYDHRDDHIVIDDTDNIFADNTVFGVLRVAFNTGEGRRVNYNSPSPWVADIPKDFTISSRLLIITNGLKESTVMEAFRNRAVCIDFRPSVGELCGRLRHIIDTVPSVPKDDVVYDLFKRYAPVAKKPNFRAYILTATMKPRGGIDWHRHLQESLSVDPLTGAMLRATEEGGSFSTRSKRFTKLTGRSARTYARLLHDYRERE